MGVVMTAATAESRERVWRESVRVRAGSLHLLRVERLGGEGRGVGKCMDGRKVEHLCVSDLLTPGASEGARSHERERLSRFGSACPDLALAAGEVS